ncbi:MAG: DUF3572 domain-containing protein [Alphaproteobacteria bacterium]|nr:DUF3572 domain-containing protein [Alphaproteobacteria bacterium]
MSQDPREAAEIVAIQALSFVAGTPHQLGRFLAETGIGPDTLRGTASDPRFLLSVLDFVLKDNEIVNSFAIAAELTPDTVAAAHQLLRDALGDRRWEHQET